ncbi:N,N-dimethylformamidase beta subunit family domain-containing protein [Streptomyces sp. NPDC001941]|uniref:N,N-dimethylformamidase beta subunit family domain-containing protein n=1 Tax=Streptomyces sp. NPDC001941 TaxID=3154659 RepID=UPI0033288711
MSARPTRRTLLGILGVGTAGAATSYAFREDLFPDDSRRVKVANTPVEPAETVEPVVDRAARHTTLAEENRLPGSRDWMPYGVDRKISGDRAGTIMGYASTTSAGHGDIVNFHVSVADAQRYRVSVFRIGHYGGTGARLMATSRWLKGARRKVPAADRATGAIECDWPVSWSLRIPTGWMSGLYQAVFTNEDGVRGSTPFVVREPQRASDLLCVIPFATYQAYNMWPKDKHTGKNLYRGYQANGKIGGADKRAFKVSFDRPYSGSGVPNWFNMDTGFARWAESSGRDVTYASSLDLHDGTVDPSKYRAVFFPGHDEYWSQSMYDAARKAVDAGGNLAFLGANNVYFHVRMEPSGAGRKDRVMACYKSAPDPAASGTGRTTRFRELSADRRYAEQGLLGIQFNGIVDINHPAPLVVKEAGHWLWTGTGLRDGEKLPAMVGIEADAHDPKSPSPAGARLTRLGVSPYKDNRPGVTWPTISEIGLTEYPNGALVFVAGTFHWPLVLVDDDDYANKTIKGARTRTVIRRATANLADRMTRKRV